MRPYYFFFFDGGGAGCWWRADFVSFRSVSLFRPARFGEQNVVDPATASAARRASIEILARGSEKKLFSPQHWPSAADRARNSIYRLASSPTLEALLWILPRQWRPEAPLELHRTKGSQKSRPKVKQNAL